LIATQPTVMREPGVSARLSPRVRTSLTAGALLLLALVLARTFLVQPVEVEGASMEPTFDSGSWVMVDKWSAQSDIERGDVIVFDAPAGSGATHSELMKRVIATAGDTVSMQACVVYVGGAALAEPYVAAEADCGTSDVAEIIVPADAVYVLGDHRSQSLDSRIFGPVPVHAVHGRVMGDLWPF
jgi:signal peptidase I